MRKRMRKEWEKNKKNNENNNEKKNDRATVWGEYEQGLSKFLPYPQSFRTFFSSHSIFNWLLNGKVS